MADWYDPTPEQRQLYADWLASRPPVVQKLGEAFPPWKLFRLKAAPERPGWPGQRVFTRALNEDGTLRVVVSAWFNLVGFEREVFGIDPGDLTECDLPVEGEPVGTANLTIEEAKAIADQRATFRDSLQEKAVDLRRFSRAAAIADIFGAA